MKRTSLIWWIGAVVLAALAGLVTYQTLATAVPSAARTDDGRLRPVVVAASDIPFRRSIGADEVTIRYFAVDTAPEGAATLLEQVVGKMSTENLYAGEPIMVPKLVTPDIVTKQLALSVPPSRVVMPVPIASMLLSHRLIRPGDRIDLIGTFELQVVSEATTRLQAQSIAALQNLEIHAIIVPPVSADKGAGEVFAAPEGATFQGNNPGEQAILLALDIQDALVIRHVLDVGGILDIVLRAPDDESMALTVPVDGSYLANRYQIISPETNR